MVFSKSLSLKVRLNLFGKKENLHVQEVNCYFIKNQNKDINSDNKLSARRLKEGALT